MDDDASLSDQIFSKKIYNRWQLIIYVPCHLCHVTYESWLVSCNLWVLACQSVIGYFWKKLIVYATSSPLYYIIYATSLIDANVSLHDWLFSKKFYNRCHIIIHVLCHLWVLAYYSVIDIFEKKSTADATSSSMP